MAGRVATLDHFDPAVYVECMEAMGYSVEAIVRADGISYLCIGPPEGFRVDAETIALQAWLNPPGESGNIDQVRNYLVRAGRAHLRPSTTAM